ncbi:hypothetical protein SE916_24910, partial [Pseudomonas sp. 5FOS]
MATIWLFNTTSDSGHKPAIGGQILTLSKNTLCLRNPWITDSVFMGKLYCASIMITMIGIYPSSFFSSDAWNPYTFDLALMIGFSLTPFIFLPFLAYRIYLIKSLSSLCLNRSTRKIYYQRLSKVLVFDWNNTGGG